VQKVEELIPDEYRMLVDVYEKKYHNEKISRRDSKKISFLLRKGFSWDLIDQFISDDTRE
jgi:SOS response regulatory protein OraA/RecX